MLRCNFFLEPAWPAEVVQKLILLNVPQDSIIWRNATDLYYMGARCDLTDHTNLFRIFYPDAISLVTGEDSDLYPEGLLGFGESERVRITEEN